MIKFTIIKMTKMINNLISGRETQLRSPFYSPLNSMWQVGASHDDDDDNEKRVIISLSGHGDDPIRWEGITLKDFKKGNHDDDGDNEKRVIISGRGDEH